MGKRKTFEITGVKHGAPIPMGTRIGNMLFSSGIIGQDPATGELPFDPALQTELVFQHMAELLRLAGGTTDDIGHVTVFVKNNNMREHVNHEWLKMFPDEQDRPARHTIVLDLPGDMLVQTEIIAVLD